MVGKKKWSNNKEVTSGSRCARALGEDGISCKGVSEGEGSSRSKIDSILLPIASGGVHYQRGTNESKQTCQFKLGDLTFFKNDQV